MVKRLLLGLVAVALFGVASAQKVEFKPVGKLMHKNFSLVDNSLLNKVNVQSYGKNVGAQKKAQLTAKSPKLSPMQRAGEEKTTIWWSYPQASNGAMSLMGFGMTEYNLAIFVPASYAGAKLDSVELFFYSPEYISDLKVWVDAAETTLPATAEEADMYVDVPSSDIQGAVIEGGNAYLSATPVELPEPYVIPEGGCFVGYSFTALIDAENPDSYANYPIITYSGEETNGSFFMYQNGKWYTMYDTGYGNLAVNIHLDVTGMPSSDVAAAAVLEAPARLNTEVPVGVVVQNNGFADVTELSYILTNNQVASAEQTITLDEPIASGGRMYVYPTTVVTKNGLNTVSVQITKVNGEDNTSTSNTASGYIIGVENPYDRTSVVEELTGTWCGWCPRGHVGLEMTKSRLGDKVITLAGHFSQSETSIDPMECAEYYEVPYNLGSSFPSAFYDRCSLGDPYLGLSIDVENNLYQYGGDKAVQTVSDAYPSEGKVELAAEWTDDSKQSIKVSAKTQFGYDRLSSPYALGFILSEDGMSGTSQDWYQFNYYSPEWAAYYQQKYGVPFTDADPYHTEEMDSWFNLGANVNMVYNSVVVGAWNPLEGIEGSVDEIFAGETAEYKTTLDISDNTLIQDKNKLYLTALLINRNNYTIVNAAQVALGNGTVGIENVTDGGSNAVEVARYNVSGVRLNAPQKGINIVKYSDGTSKTVVVK